MTNATRDLLARLTPGNWRAVQSIPNRTPEWEVVTDAIHPDDVAEGLEPDPDDPAGRSVFDEATEADARVMAASKELLAGALAVVGAGNPDEMKEGLKALRAAVEKAVGGLTGKDD